jgi:predicted ester cyclase
MSIEENKKSCYRCFEEVWNQGDLSVIPEVISPDYNDGVRKGITDFENMVKTMRDVMPDMKYTIDEVVGEGDTLAVRLGFSGTFTGKMGDIEPTGKKGSINFVLFNRYEDGKCVESSAFPTITDSLVYYQQWGIPLPKQ